MPEITERDAKGRIKKVEWEPGEKLEASRKGGLARSFTKAEAEEYYLAILDDMGYPDPNEAPALVQLAARQAVLKSSFPALQFIDKKTESTSSPPKSGRLELQPGERCPTCGFYLLPGDEGRAQIVGNELLSKLRMSRETEQEQNIGDDKFQETLTKLRASEEDERNDQEY